MFKKVPLGIKIIVFINTIINLLLLLSSFILLNLGLSFYILGLSVILINILLGVGILLLKNWVRICFIVMQVVGLILSSYPFLIILQFGLGNPSQFGDNYEPWAAYFTPFFWKQLISFVIGMFFPIALMLFSLFCIVYLSLPKVKRQFELLL